MAKNDVGFEGASKRDMFIGASIILMPILLLFGVEIIFSQPTPVPPEMVWGCYSANGAPPLRIKGGLIEIAQAQPIYLHYVSEPAKFGFRLSVSPAFSLRSAGIGKYLFAKDERGIGYFWPLLPKGSENPQSMREPSDYGGRFQIIANDLKAIIYSRTSSAAYCR